MNKIVFLIMLFYGSFVQAATFIDPIGNTVDYDLNGDQPVINISDFPDKIKKGYYIARINYPLKINFSNLPEGVVSTTLIRGDLNGYYSYILQNEAQKVKNGNSTHKILISSVRPTGNLELWELGLLDSEGKIIDTKPVRFNFHTYGPGETFLCNGQARCYSYSFPNEEVFYGLEQSCREDGGVRVDDNLCF